MFSFNEIDTKIFEYSKGERNEDGTFKSIFADPAKIKRHLEICLPNRAALVNQHLDAERIKDSKRVAFYAAAKAREADPSLPEPSIQYSDDESAMIRMGGIAEQKLCIGVRDAFELLEFNESTGAGCTDYMVIAVMNHWFDWLEKKSGSTPATATSSPPSPAV